MAFGLRQAHLHKRGGVYYCRIALPKRLGIIVGRSEYKKSLQTSDLRIARIMCRDLSNRMEAFFMMVKAMRPSDEHINSLIKHYFEKSLAMGEQTLTSETVIMRTSFIDEYDPNDIQITAAASEKNLAALADLKRRRIYGATQEQEAMQLLKAHGYELNTGGDRYHQLCLNLVRAGYEAERIKLAHYTGDVVAGQIQDPMFKDCRNYFEQPDPEYFVRNTGTISHTATAQTLEEVIALYLEDKKIKRNRKKGCSEEQIKRIGSFLARVKDVLGKNKPASSITKQDGFSVERAMYQLPANYTQKHASKGVGFQKALSSDAEKLDPRTLEQYMAQQKAFFRWANKYGYIPVDAMMDVELPEKKKTKRGEVRRPFTPEELKTLFQSPMFIGRKNTERMLWVRGDHDVVVRDGNFWVPLVGAYTGMRLGEILYLLPKDVRLDGNVWYIDVNKDDEGKKLKTVQSCRKIPVHPELIKMGFLEYVQTRTAVCEKTKERLFEDGITIPKNQAVTKNQSRNFSDYLKKVEIKTDKKLVFHSFRHNFVDQIREMTGITEEIMNALDGREAGTEKTSSTRDGYGSDLKPSFLYDWIEKIDYGIDLSHLYPKDE